MPEESFLTDSDKSEFRKNEREKDNAPSTEKSVQNHQTTRTGWDNHFHYGLSKVYKGGIPLHPVLDKINSPY